jgi:fructose PTS system EIIBC or EIIC component
MKIVAVTSCPTGIAHTLMAAEALKKIAEVTGHEIKIETQGSVGSRNVLSETDIAEAAVVILATDIRVDASRFAGKPVYETRISEAIRNTRQVIESAIGLAPMKATPDPKPAEVAPDRAPEAEKPHAAKRLVGITSCPTGIAHTFMPAS